jgi:hypothetical protein
MKLKLNIKGKKKRRLVAWIQKSKEFNDNAHQIFRFFKDKIKISKLSKILNYYIVSSENPGIILSLFSTIQELIPEVYFNLEESLGIKESINEFK